MLTIKHIIIIIILRNKNENNRRNQLKNLLIIFEEPFNNNKKRYVVVFLSKIIDFSNDDGVMMNGDDDGGFLRMFRRELCVMLLPLAALEDAETASLLNNYGFSLQYTVFKGSGWSFRCNIPFFLRARGGNPTC